MPWHEIAVALVTVFCAALQEEFRRKRRYRKFGIRKPPAGEVIS